jgi:hypothetical protein
LRAKRGASTERKIFFSSLLVAHRAKRCSARPAFGYTWKSVREPGACVCAAPGRGVRVVEGARLENEWALQASRGFESHPLRPVEVCRSRFGG